MQHNFRDLCSFLETCEKAYNQISFIDWSLSFYSNFSNETYAVGLLTDVIVIKAQIICCLTPPLSFVSQKTQ